MTPFSNQLDLKSKKTDLNCQNLNFQSHFNLIRSIEPQKIDTLIEIGPYFFLTKLAPIGWKLQN